MPLTGCGQRSCRGAFLHDRGHLALRTLYTHTWHAHQHVQQIQAIKSARPCDKLGSHILAALTNTAPAHIKRVASMLSLWNLAALVGRSTGGDAIFVTSTPVEVNGCARRPAQAMSHDCTALGSQTDCNCQASSTKQGASVHTSKLFSAGSASSSRIALAKSLCARRRPVQAPQTIHAQALTCRKTGVIAASNGTFIP